MNARAVLKSLMVVVGTAGVLGTSYDPNPNAAPGQRSAVDLQPGETKLVTVDVAFDGRQVTAPGTFGLSIGADPNVTTTLRLVFTPPDGEEPTTRERTREAGVDQRSITFNAEVPPCGEEACTFTYRLTLQRMDASGLVSSHSLVAGATLDASGQAVPVDDVTIREEPVEPADGE